MQIDEIMRAQRLYALEVSNEGHCLIEEFDDMCRRNLKCEDVAGIDSFKVVYAGSFSDCYEKREKLMITFPGKGSDTVQEVDQGLGDSVLLAIVVNPKTCDIDIMLVDELTSYNIKRITEGKECLWYPVYISSDVKSIHKEYKFLHESYGREDD